MIYAFILLAIVAVLTWSAWTGVPIPDIPFEEARIKLMDAYNEGRSRAKDAIKDKVRQQLHEAVDEALDE